MKKNKMNFKRIALTALLVGKSLLLLLGCSNSSSGPGSGDPDARGFDEAAFREWARQPERSFSVDGGSANYFSTSIINGAVAFARSNWDRNTHRNDAATFNLLTRRFLESEMPGDSITVTKSGKTINYANPLGSYMLEQRRIRA